ncbi:hypothetical protein D3C80_1569200 [compost metagenome]
MASAAAPGMRSASLRAVSAVPVVVATVSTGPLPTASPAEKMASYTRALHSALTSARADPKPSSSRLRKPSCVSAPRSAETIASATTRVPIAACPTKPPPMPALMTRRYLPSPFARAVAVPAAAAAEPTPAAITSMPPISASPRMTACFSASTAVTIRMRSPSSLDEEATYGSRC